MRKTANITAAQAMSISAGALVLAAADQAAKWLAAMYLARPYPVFTWLQFGYRQNTGIAWSIQLPYTLLLALNFVLVAAFAAFAAKNFDFRKPLARLAAILVAAGACGNLIDRLLKGYVVDFISVWIWPVFNLADAYLTAGIFLILLVYAKIKRT